MTTEFIELSVALTGFSRVDLEGTGVADEYWQTLLDQVGEQTCGELLSTWIKVRDSVAHEQESLELEIGANIFKNPDYPELAAVARNIIKMWYLGLWEADAKTFVVSGEAYQQGLVWDAINAHPQAAKQPGFGTWSLPPGEIS